MICNIDDLLKAEIEKLQIDRKYNTRNNYIEHYKSLIQIFKEKLQNSLQEV